MSNKDKNININTKKSQINNNVNNKISDNDIIKNIKYLLQNCNFNEDIDKYKMQINEIKEIFKYNLQDTSFINSLFYKIKKFLLSSSLDFYQKTNFLSLLTFIIEINPNKFHQYTDIILSTYQFYFTESYSNLFPIISQHFGDLIKLELSSLNNINIQSQKIINDSLLLVYNKYKSFCINNIRSVSIHCQICGTLCLTSFIENCSFIYESNDKLKDIIDILLICLDNPTQIGKLEILNCFTSLIFCTEIQYIPFAKYTAKKIIDLCTNQEWIIRKFALNIICTLMYYCQEEIYPLKDLIMQKLKYLKNEKSQEIKELYEQINNNFLEAEKKNNDNYLNPEKITIEKKIKKNSKKKNKIKNNKFNRNYDFIFINSDNHLITDPGNLNNINKNNNNMDKNNIINNLGNNICSPNMHNNKKNNNKIINKTEIKKVSTISRSKSFGQKNILKMKSKDIKNKIKDITTNNRFGKMLSYYNMTNTFKDNYIKCLDSKNNSSKKNKCNNNKKNNNFVNSTKIAVNNRFFFIKNYSLMIKSNILKNKNGNKYNKSFLIKENNIFSNNDKKLKDKITKLNNINFTDNIVNESSTIINNKDANSFRKITPQKSFNNKLKKKNIIGPAVKRLKENKTKNYINNYCSKLLKKINSGINKKFENNKKNINKKNKTNKKNKSADKCNNSKIKYLDNNYISRNFLATLRDSSRCINRKKLTEYNFNSNSKKINKRNIIHPDYNICFISENKSLKNDTVSTSRKSSCVLKKIKKNEQRPIPMGSSALKRNNFQKLIKQNIHSKNSKEKSKNSPLKFSKSLLNESDNKEKLKEIKILKIKSQKDKIYDTFNKNKKLNKYLFKNKSISINNKNSLNNEITLNIIVENDNKIKNNSSFNKFMEYKKTKKFNQKENKYKKIYNNTYIYKKSNYELQNEFDKYKQDTNKIIFELKNKVDELQKTIYDYESESKNKKKIRELVKNKEFIKAFDFSINLDKANNIYYILKKYNCYMNENNNNKCELNDELLSKIINIISKDENFFENISIIISFCINNISKKKIKIEYDTNKLLYNKLLNSFNQRKELGLSELDIDNIKYLINYFKIK